MLHLGTRECGFGTVLDRRPAVCVGDFLAMAVLVLGGGAAAVGCVWHFWEDGRSAEVEVEIEGYLLLDGGGWWLECFGHQFILASPCVLTMSAGIMTLVIFMSVLAMAAFTSILFVSIIVLGIDSYSRG